MVVFECFFSGMRFRSVWSIFYSDSSRLLVHKYSTDDMDTSYTSQWQNVSQPQKDCPAPSKDCPTPETVPLQRLSNSKDCPIPKTVPLQRLSCSKDCPAPKTVPLQRLSHVKDCPAPKAAPLQRLSNSLFPFFSSDRMILFNQTSVTERRYRET